MASLKWWRRVVGLYTCVTTVSLSKSYTKCVLQKVFRRFLRHFPKWRCLSVFWMLRWGLEVFEPLFDEAHLPWEVSRSLYHLLLSSTVSMARWIWRPQTSLKGAPLYSSSPSLSAITTTKKTPALLKALYQCHSHGLPCSYVIGDTFFTHSCMYCTLHVLTHAYLKTYKAPSLCGRAFDVFPPLMGGEVHQMQAVK